MRYLKVVAQDLNGRGTADTLHFSFHDGERLGRDATVAELKRLRVFGNTYLKCAWYNLGDGNVRHLRVFSGNASGDGTPEIVHLHFHDGTQIAYKAAMQDLDNDGELELILCSDVDNDGHANRTDRNRVKALVREFLKLGWS